MTIEDVKNGSVATYFTLFPVAWLYVGLKALNGSLLLRPKPVSRSGILCLNGNAVWEMLTRFLTRRFLTFFGEN
ncbi:MAG: hypothetical protein AAB447_02285 [Patescibacteria group bacterium]